MLLMELPDAGRILTEEFWYPVFPQAERVFEFPVPTEEFVSTGITSNDEFPSVLDGDPVVKSFRNMTIQAGHIVRPTNRCKGMYLYIAGDLIVDGELTMTARGCKGAGSYICIDPITNRIYMHPTDIFTEDKHPLFGIIGANGGAGGPKSSHIYSEGRTIAGVRGGVGINGACGGGGAGALYHWKNTAHAAGGSAGTSFSGGAGGGGTSITAPGNHPVNYNNAENGASDGGAGGYGVAAADVATKPHAAGGGAGNPGGGNVNGPNGASATKGESGTGGLMILIVRGNIVLGSSGKITSNGSRGGSVTGPWGGARGAGSGGGAIHIFHKGTFTDQQKVQVTGGLGGANTTSVSPTLIGGAGGDGSKIITAM
jgi:hypothetical protein